MNLRFGDNPQGVISQLEAQGVFDQVQLVSPVTSGASGARVYRVTDRVGSYVVKHAYPSLCGGNQDMQTSYEREWRFYSALGHLSETAIPQIVYLANEPELGIILVFPYYRTIQLSDWSEQLQLRAMDVCARIHSLDPDFLKGLGGEFSPACLDNKRLDQSLVQWNRVLSLHDRRFDPNRLKAIYDNMDTICRILNEPPYTVCHGDFHPGNIMLDQDRLIVCDWQNVGIAKGAGDVSFFISRGKAAGIAMEEAQLVDYYRQRLSFYTGTQVSGAEVYAVINASTAYVSFMFWAYYLTDADVHSVWQVYDRMVSAFQALRI